MMPEMTEPNARKTPSYGMPIAVFAVFGPPIGLLSLFSTILAEPGTQLTLPALLWLLPFAYLMGLLPALVTALGVVSAARRLRPGVPAAVVLAAAIGFVVVSLSAALDFLREPDVAVTVQGVMDILKYGALAGAVPAAACSLIQAALGKWRGLR